MTNFIGTQQSPPLSPFPPPSVPHTLCLASRSREHSRKKGEGGGKTHKSCGEKKMCGESWKSHCMSGAVSLLCQPPPPAGPGQQPQRPELPQIPTDRARTRPHPRPLLPRQPIVLHCIAPGAPSLLQNPGTEKYHKLMLMPSCTALGLDSPAPGWGPWWQCAGWERPFPGLLLGCVMDSERIII